VPVAAKLYGVVTKILPAADSCTLWALPSRHTLDAGATALYPIAVALVRETAATEELAPKRVQFVARDMLAVAPDWKPRHTLLLPVVMPFAPEPVDPEPAPMQVFVAPLVIEKPALNPRRQLLLAPVVKAIPD
jgi:hypothetical protein